MVQITAFMTLLGRGFVEDEASVLRGGALLTPDDLEGGSSSQGGVETGHLANDLPHSCI